MQAHFQRTCLVINESEQTSLTGSTEQGHWTRWRRARGISASITHTHWGTKWKNAGEGTKEASLDELHWGQWSTAQDQEHRNRVSLAKGLVFALEQDPHIPFPHLHAWTSVCLRAEGTDQKEQSPSNVRFLDPKFRGS